MTWCGACALLPPGPACAADAYARYHADADRARVPAQVGLAPWFAAGGTGIDTALDYKDQPVIGQLLAAAKKPRGSYFMTTKIPTHRVKSLTAAYALSAVQTDVKQLGIGRLDLVLIHHPAPTDAENQALWKGLEQAVAMNLTRSIGLSNFNKEQIEALLKVATIRPALNQCDLSVGGACNSGNTKREWVVVLTSLARPHVPRAHTGLHRIVRAGEPTKPT